MRETQKLQNDWVPPLRKKLFYPLKMQEYVRYIPWTSIAVNLKIIGGNYLRKRIQFLNLLPQDVIETKEKCNSRKGLDLNMHK